MDVTEHPDLGIVLADGTRLSARAWLPETDEPVPAILEYLPYRKRDGTVERDALTHPWFAENGYACLRVDTRGNGDSEGLMFDEYTEVELADCEAVIDWIATQPWCSGAVGMMGISWGGFNSLQLAARQPAALKAIVTLCSTVDRFADDIHYKGGCLLNENLGWSATMFSYSSRPPDPALVGDAWREMWLDRVRNLPMLAATWLEHPTRDDYWRHGSVCEDFASIQAATLAVGGWGDAYVNAVPALVENLSAPVKGITGPWVHKYPHFAAPEPRIGFLQEALRWWDRYLMGVENGVENEPDWRGYLLESRTPRFFTPHTTTAWLTSRPLPHSPAPLPRPRSAACTPGNSAPSGSARRCRTINAPTTHWLPVSIPLRSRRTCPLSGVRGCACACRAISRWRSWRFVCAMCNRTARAAA